MAVRFPYLLFGAEQVNECRNCGEEQAWYSLVLAGTSLRIQDHFPHFLSGWLVWNPEAVRQASALRQLRLAREKMDFAR
jgi:hypothetical protein